MLERIQITREASCTRRQNVPPLPLALCLNELYCCLCTSALNNQQPFLSALQLTSPVATGKFVLISFLGCFRQSADKWNKQQQGVMSAV